MIKSFYSVVNADTTKKTFTLAAALQNKTNAVIRNLLLCGVATILLAGLPACKENPVPPKQEVHPLIGKWKLVSTAEGRYIKEFTRGIPDSAWVPVEADIYQEFRVDSTIENWIFYFKNIPVSEWKNNNEYWYYISNDTIIYRRYDPSYNGDNWMNYAFMQIYELSNNELTLYLILNPGMDGNAARDIVYRNFKFIRIEGDSE